MLLGLVLFSRCFRLSLMRVSRELICWFSKMLFSVISVILKAACSLEKSFLISGKQWMVSISLRMVFLGPKYSAQLTILRVSKWPVKRLLSLRAPLAMALNLPIWSL